MNASSTLRLTIIILAAAVLAAIVPTLQLTRAAGPWYVAPGGTDGNTCTSPGAPCATINGAIGKATSGDTIFVATGVYTGTGDQVVFLDKSATLSGGWDSTFTSQDGASSIDGQSARRGIAVDAGVTATIDHFTIQNGSAFTGDWNGGGVHNNGTLTLIDSAITNNTAVMAGPGIGGGIYSIGVMTLTLSTISSNQAEDAGGIANAGVLRTLSTTIESNSAAYHGGGIRNTGNLELSSTSISSNTANGGSGGGLYNSGITAIRNTSITGNSTPNYGGGIYNSGTFDLLGSTIVSNSAHSGWGGGIRVDSGSLTLKNTIVADNPLGGDCDGMIASGGHNLSSDNTCGLSAAGDMMNTNPLLGPLEDNGGPTLTHLPLPHSPAINNGDNNGCPTTDQRGIVRPQKGICDIGAVEVEFPHTIYLPFVSKPAPPRQIFMAK